MIAAIGILMYVIAAIFAARLGWFLGKYQEHKNEESKNRCICSAAGAIFFWLIWTVLLFCAA